MIKWYACTLLTSRAQTPTVLGNVAGIEIMLSVMRVDSPLSREDSFTMTIYALDSFCRRVGSIDVARRDHADRDGLAHGTIRGGRRHRLDPLEAAPAAAIGLEVVASIAIASMAMRLVSRSGHFQLQRGRVRAAQRFLRHQHGSVGRLDGPG